MNERLNRQLGKGIFIVYLYTLGTEDKIIQYVKHMGKNHIIKKHFKNLDYKIKNCPFLLDVEQKQGKNPENLKPVKNLHCFTHKNKVYFLLHTLKFNDLRPQRFVAL